MTEAELKAEISSYFNARNNGAKQKNLIKRAELIHEEAKHVSTNDKWILKFANGEVVTNKYGRKLYFKFGD